MILGVGLCFLLAILERSTQEGKDFGNERNKRNKVDATTLRENAILAGEKDENPRTIAEQRLNSDAQEMMDKRSEARQRGDRLQGDVRIDALLQGGDHCVNDPTGPLAITVNTTATPETFVDCIETPKSVDHKVFYVYRTLQLKVFHQARIQKKRCCRTIKRCTHMVFSHDDDSSRCGKYRWITNAETRDLEMSQDCSSLGWAYYDCNHITIQDERTEIENESWELEDPQRMFDRVRDNSCNLCKTECVEGPATRYFSDVGFHRDCWKQRLMILCPSDIPKTSECEELRKKGCLEQSEQCLQTDVNGQCVKWKKRYRCPAQSTKMVHGGPGSIHNIGGGSLTGQPEKFDDLAAALTQLQVLSEMQKEVKNITSTRQNVQVFKGQCNRCKKNILENVLYDCCAIQGLAMDLNLVNCNAEERQLATLRAEGKCQYVGCTQNQFMGMWTSSDTHVYCCYPSPLIAHLQKEARKQLGKDFGPPTNPDCNGLSVEEIQRVDFSKMDLSPLFDDVLKKARTNTPPLDMSKVNERMAEKIKRLKLDIAPQA